MLSMPSKFYTALSQATRFYLLVKTRARLFASLADRRKFAWRQELGVFRCVAFATHFFVIEVNGTQNKMVFEREIDKVGRLVIPVDVRRMYDIKDKDILCLIPQEDGILIRKAEE